MITRILLALGVAVLMAPLTYAAEKPNVVILLADDEGYQDIGCYDGPVKTPDIDALATGGVRFHDFYSAAANCSPSRATLLTGRHHIRAGVYGWINDTSQRTHLLLRENTLAEILKQEGYATAHIGKWHLGMPNDKFDKPTPDKHGFDYWFATGNNAIPSHKNPRNFVRNGKPVGKLQGYSCQLVVDEAIDWLDTKRPADQPFFLNMWFHEPHAPIAAPDEIVKEYGALDDPAAVYSATIDNRNRAIARLVAKLHAIDKPENTLIIYASDNGSYRDDRTGGLRGRKRFNWEGGIRVPGIFFWPGKIPPGRVISSDTPAGLVDVLPTVCGLLGISPPKGRHLDGSDLTPILIPGEKKFVRHQPLFWHLQRSVPIVAMRDGPYSFVGYRDFDVPDALVFKEEWIPALKKGTYTNYQLFNLLDDPKQEHDLASQHPELVAQLKQKLMRINTSIMSDGADWHLPE